jgi:very-short-patch-repair endonuclease
MKSTYTKEKIQHIQSLYDQGLSWRDIIKQKLSSWKTIQKLVKEDKLKSRDKSTALKLKAKQCPQTHSQETKDKLSKIRIKYLKENPDKVPYLLNHYSKGSSYPEKYFIEVFKNENIPLQQYLQISLYQLDFYNEEYKIDVEIDGEQHYVDNRIVESDIRRTKYLESLGWKIIRIRWSKYQKLSHDEKIKVIQNLKAMICLSCDINESTKKILAN